jgi:hypothetical protein
MGGFLFVVGTEMPLATASFRRRPESISGHIRDIAVWTKSRYRQAVFETFGTTL